MEKPFWFPWFIQTYFSALRVNYERVLLALINDYFLWQVGAGVL